MDIQGTVRDILQDKGDQVWTTYEDTKVYDALGKMGVHNIGALVVLDSNDRVVGVMSERDYSRKVVLQGRTSRDTKVADIVHRPAVTVEISDSVTHCMKIMSDLRIRHLPVMQDGDLMGMVSMGDIVRWIMESQRYTIEYLQGYILGEY